MANLHEFLAGLRRQGVALAVGAGDSLTMRAKRPVEPALLREIAARKPWLLAYLRAQALPDAGGFCLVLEALASLGAQLEASPAGLTLAAGTMADFAEWAGRWLGPWAAEARRIGLLWPASEASPAA